MRKAGLALAVVATTQLTLLSSPAFADDSASASGSISIGGSASTSGAASASASTTASASGSAPATAPDSDSSSSKKTTGWVLVRVGGALTVGGIVTNAIAAANSGVTSGMGGGSDSGQSNNTRTDLLFAGTFLIVAGVVTGVYGGSMVWSASKGVDSKASDRPEDDAKTDGVTKVAQARFASSPTFTVPLLSGKF
jgi:hypothetical protein